jgi:uncharacterized protein (TIGR00255 family)
MIRSMTGFGEAERDTPAGRLRAEIRTVNHRFFSVNLKLARALERFDPSVREWLRALMPRGHVNCSIRLEVAGADGGSAGLRLDEARARQYLQALSELKERLALPGQVDVAMVARYGDILVLDDEEAVTVEAADIQAVVEAAAGSTVTMREQEGQRLNADLEDRLRGIEVAMALIEQLAPARLITERDRIRRVVTELLDGVQVDEERVAREIAFLAEKWDISEELVRLRSHLSLFRESLESDKGEPVGKRLGFLVQEMNRETNTIGSKANDAAVEHRVVAIKEEIERLREQVDNVE